MTVNETCRAPRTSIPPHDSHSSLAGDAPPGAVADPATPHPALEQLPVLERGEGAGGDERTDRRLRGFQSKQAGVAPGGGQIRPYQHPEGPRARHLPDEVWEKILEAAVIPHEVDPLDIEHFKPESLRLLFALRLTSKRVNRLTAPVHDALVLADGFVKGRATAFAKDSLKELPRLQLEIPTVAHLEQGLRWLTAEPSEDVAQATVVTTNRQKIKEAVPKAKGQLKRLLGRQTATAEGSSAPAAAPSMPLVLRWNDLRQDGGYRQRLEELKVAEIEQLWPILGQAWPASMTDNGNTPGQWVRPLAVLSGLDLSPERKEPILTQKVWPKLAHLQVESRSEPLAALLMQHDLPEAMLVDATQLLKKGHKRNCGTRAHAQALGALAVWLHRKPLEQRLDALAEMLEPNGKLSLYDLSPEHLALALMPLANLNINDASAAERQLRFEQAEALRSLLPNSSEMYRLLPRVTDDPHHMLVRIRRVQWAKFDPTRPEDGLGLERDGPITVDELFRIPDGPVRPANQPMSLDDFRQLISIARMGYLPYGPERFASFLEFQASTLGCLKPEELLPGARTLLVEMHRTYAIDASLVLRTLVGSVSTEGKSQADEPLTLLRVPANDLPALLGLLQREIDSPLAYNPRLIISRMEAVLCHRSDVETIRPQVKRWLEGLVARHPYLIVDELTANPKLRLEPLSKFWQRQVK